MIASGRMFGKNTKIELNLLGSTRNSSALKGAAMEL